MRTEIYTLDKNDLETLRGIVPDYVVDRADVKGYFTLGAVKKGNEDEGILGVAQFYVNITPKGECFAEIIYVFVEEEYRRQGMGTKLVERISRVLKKSSINTATFIIPEPIDGRLEYEVSAKEIAAFFKECGYTNAKEERELLITTQGEIVTDLKDRKVLRFLSLIGK